MYSPPSESDLPFPQEVRLLPAAGGVVVEVHVELQVADHLDALQVLEPHEHALIVRLEEGEVGPAVDGAQVEAIDPGLRIAGDVETHILESDEGGHPGRPGLQREGIAQLPRPCESSDLLDQATRVRLKGEEAAPLAPSEVPSGGPRVEELLRLPQDDSLLPVALDEPLVFEEADHPVDSRRGHGTLLRQVGDSGGRPGGEQQGAEHAGRLGRQYLLRLPPLERPGTRDLAANVHRVEL